MTVRGADISNNQRDVDLTRAASEIDFLIHKVAEGLDWIDPAYHENSAATPNAERIDALRTRRGAARAAGLLWTGYFWPRPQPRREARREAHHFRDTMEKVGWKRGVDMPQWVDIEAAYRNQYGVLSTAQLVKYVFDLIAECDALFEVKSVVYTGYFWRDSTWRNPAGGGAVPAMANPERQCENPLALAAYVNDPARYVPRSWSDRKNPITFHQATEHGTVDGIGRGAVDIDFFMGSKRKLQQHVAGRK